MEDKELEGHVDDRTARCMARATHSSSAPVSEVAAGTMISGIAVDLDAPCYSRNPYNPYPSGDTLSYGLWEVMGLERLGALISPSEPASDGRFELSVTGDVGDSHCMRLFTGLPVLRLVQCDDSRMFT